MPLDCTPYVPPTSEAQVPVPAVPAESNSCVFESVYFPAPSKVMTPVRLQDSVKSPFVSLRKSTYRNRYGPLKTRGSAGIESLSRDPHRGHRHQKSAAKKKSSFDRFMHERHPHWPLLQFKIRL